MAGKIKKILVIILIAYLMLNNTLLTRVVLADEVENEVSQAQIETPASEPTITETNNAVLENNVQTVSNTGENIINITPVPSPVEDIEVKQLTQPEEILSSTTQEPSLDEALGTENTNPEPVDETNNQESSSASLINNGDVINNINSDSNTGQNLIASVAASIVPASNENDNSCVVDKSSAGGNIQSGEALAETTIDNSVNTNSVNSQVIYQTINIFIDQSGNLNLSDPFEVASSMIQDHPSDQIINVSFTNLENYAFVSNNVISYANTGQNSINAGEPNVEAIVNTGNAYSIVSLLNKVNFTIVNSVVHVVSINVFGKLNGNIILPDIKTSSCVECGMSLVAENNATVINKVDSKANSGQNIVNGEGIIDSGNAASIVNNLNLINANYVNTSVYGLFINLLGSWFGDFIGWNGLAAQSGASNHSFFSSGGLLPEGSNSCASCVGDLNINNSAYVENNIASFANTGQNLINGKGDVKTGNSYSTVSLINFVNANFINSVGFFGFLNIFGDWTGDIGGKTEFEVLDNAHNEQNNQSENNKTKSEENVKQEEGGLLSVEQTNNVGQYVYPGDTVTFFVKVKNPGGGKVYGTKLKLFLVKDGETMGGGIFDIGDIPSGKTVKLSTGLVLSKDATPGKYIAVALAEGNVGPDNRYVYGQSESSFNILHSSINSMLTNSDKSSILGTKNFNNTIKAAGQTRESAYFIFLIIVISTYLMLRIYRKKEYVAALFLSKTSFKDKLTNLKIFLF